jgi:hypothetical protein
MTTKYSVASITRIIGDFSVSITLGVKEKYIVADGNIRDALMTIKRRRIKSLTLLFITRYPRIFQETPIGKIIICCKLSTL